MVFLSSGVILRLGVFCALSFEVLKDRGFLSFFLSLSVCLQLMPRAKEVYLKINFLDKASEKILYLLV